MTFLLPRALFVTPFFLSRHDGRLQWFSFPWLRFLTQRLAGILFSAAVFLTRFFSPLSVVMRSAFFHAN